MYQRGDLRRENVQRPLPTGCLKRRVLRQLGWQVRPPLQAKGRNWLFRLLLLYWHSSRRDVGSSIRRQTRALQGNCRITLTPAVLTGRHILVRQHEIRLVLYVLPRCDFSGKEHHFLQLFDGYRYPSVPIINCYICSSERMRHNDRHGLLLPDSKHQLGLTPLHFSQLDSHPPPLCYRLLP